METYFLGTHRVRHLKDIIGVPTSPGYDELAAELDQIVDDELRRLLFPFDMPMFPTVPSLAKYKRLRGDAFPKAMTIYALDSGGYNQLALHGEYELSPDDHGGAAYRFAEDLGVPPLWAAPQDFMCEHDVIAKTGLTVWLHQQYTIDSLLYLRENFPHIWWIPVLQGWTIEDYLRHVEMYRAAGIDLTTEDLVGVGSICKRPSVAEIVSIITVLHSLGLKLHAFGVKRNSLPRIAHMIVSADSLAWSRTARDEEIRLRGCAHKGLCNNCLTWALQWRLETLATLVTPTQPGLGLEFLLPSGRDSPTIAH
ncbi:deazapurine DNA modification protein DpdA family protein [Lentzea terrae]|uniref:deazapurine DNA modification protein DpdA family protein n=1 Tax=Lentzea terrae TaxID=2200761 RepID=UPI000DD38894|nr:hypothetical protein [Lentzea terrae]